MRYALIFLLLATPVIAGTTNLVPRVQCDFSTRNATTASALVTSFRAAVSGQRVASIDAKQFNDPDGIIRIHMLYEFATFSAATNFFTAANALQVTGVSGRLSIYCQPEEFTRITDWAGADRDTRAKRTEVLW